MAAVRSVLPDAIAQPLPPRDRHVACDSAGPDEAGGGSAGDDSKNARARASVHRHAGSDTAFTPPGNAGAPVPVRRCHARTCLTHADARLPPGEDSDEKKGRACCPVQHGPATGHERRALSRSSSQTPASPPRLTAIGVLVHQPGPRDTWNP